MALVTTPSRDVSFSAYLNSREETFVLQLAESIEKPSTTINTQREALILGRKKADGEIGVFGAEKYFNEKMEEEEEAKGRGNGGVKYYQKNEERVVVHHLKPDMRLGTPSSCSEVSWNSKSALLTGLARDRSPNLDRQYRANSKSFLATLGCSCSCYDKKSIEIHEDCGSGHGRMISKVPVDIKQTTLPPPSWSLEKGACNNMDSFAFPNAKSGVRNLIMEQEEQEMMRKSLEVFGSPVLKKEDIALNLEKRLNMLTWDANPRIEGISGVPSIGSGMKIDEISVLDLPGPLNIGSGTKIDDTDGDSDSSSDLFEIKSLANNTNPFLTHRESDGMSACMSPSSCYEPSEASIDWSVVTASAANFSVASDYEETKSLTGFRNPRLLMTTTENTITKPRATPEKEVPKRRASILSGCKSQKSVGIVSEAHMITPKKFDQRKPPRPGSVSSMSRFQAETKVTDIGSAQAQHVFTTHSQMHPVRANTLYMA